MCGALSGTSPLPPDAAADQRQQQRYADQKADADDAELSLAQHQAAVFRGAWLDGDEAFFAGEPVHHVYAQVDVAAVTGKTVGEERSAAYHHDALFAIADVALQRHGDSDRAGGVVLFIEAQLGG